MSEVNEQFPMAQFQEIFTNTPKIKTKLAPFLAKFKENKMNWIYKALEEIYRLMVTPEVELTWKFNSIFGLKFLFDTSHVIIVNLIQVYFIDTLVEIASYQANLPDIQRGNDFFLKKGYPKENPEAAKFGYNFVRLAGELLTVGAMVKPKRLFQFNQISDISEFANGYEKVKQKGFQPYPSLAYYKPGVPENQRKMFEQNLKKLDDNIEPYIDYFVQKIESQKKKKGNKGFLDPKLICQSGDVYITSAVLQNCKNAIEEENISVIKSTLEIVNEFFRWGDIQAFYIVNNEGFIDNLVREIVKDFNNGTSNDKSLSRGRNLFPKLKGSFEEKQHLYEEVLRSLQFWAVCFPTARKNINEKSNIKFILDELKQKLKLQFPEDSELRKNIAQCNQNLKKNKIRNALLLKEFQYVDPVPKSFLKLKAENKIPSQSQVKSVSKIPEINAPIKSQVTPKENDYDSIKKQILNTSLNIQSLTKNEKELSSKIKGLKSFKKSFEDQLSASNLSEDHFLELMNEGLPLIQKIDEVLPKLQEYQNKSMNFIELSESLRSKPIPAPSKKIISEAPRQEKERERQRQKQREVQIQKQKQKERQKQRQIERQRQKQRQKKRQIERQKQREKQRDIQRKIQKQKQRERQEQRQRQQFEQKKKIKESSIRKIQQLTPIKQINSDSLIQDEFYNVNSSLPEESKHSIKSRKQQILYLQSQSRPQQFQHTKQNRQLFPSRDSASSKVQKIKPPEIQITYNNNSEKRIGTPSKKIQQKKHNIHFDGDNGHLKKSQKMIQNGKDDEDNFDLGEEEEVVVRHPNKMKSTAGSYKLRADDRVEKKPKESEIKYGNEGQQIKLSRVSERSRVQFERSSVCKEDEEEIKKEYEYEDDPSDIIEQPDINPLEESYHDITELYRNIQKDEKPSFKKCFQTDQYLFAKEKNQKMFWLQNDTINLIRPTSSKKNTQSRIKESKINVPQILNERNKKFQEEIKSLEEEKDRKIKDLQKQVKVLESEGLNMKEKIRNQDHELRSIRDSSSQRPFSSNGKNLYIEDQDHLFKTKIASAQKSSHGKSFYEEKNRNPLILDPIGRLISSKNYKGFFNQFKNEKEKKNLLKNKELLYKDDDIEFGCMSRRDSSSLIITFYITAEKDIESLTYKIIGKQQLEIASEPKNIPFIRQRKQQKIFVTINILEIPYTLPEIQFFYSLDHKLLSQKFIIPCAFHKFVHIDPKDDSVIRENFSKKEQVLRSEEVPYIKKFLKSFDSLKEYFPALNIFQNGEANKFGEISYAGEVTYKEHHFLMKVSVKPNQFLYVQAIDTQNLEKRKLIEFYLCLMSNLLMKNVELGDI